MKSNTFEFIRLCSEYPITSLRFTFFSEDRSSRKIC